MTPGEAKSFRGRIIHYASTCTGRLGKGILFFIDEQASMNDPLWNHQIEFNLLFLEEILAVEAPRIIPLAPVRTRKARIWTDASFHIEANSQFANCAASSCPMIQNPKGS